MKKIIVLGAAFILTGCAYHPYEPALASLPADTAQYRKDLDECRKEAKSTPAERMANAAFGPLGMLLQGAAGNERALHSENSLVDMCMQKRGYQLKEDAT